MAVSPQAQRRSQSEQNHVLMSVKIQLLTIVFQSRAVRRYLYFDNSSLKQIPAGWISFPADGAAFNLPALLHPNDSLLPLFVML